MGEITSSPDSTMLREIALFDAFSSTYDNLRFLRCCGKRLAEMCALSSGARVLDVATGTGVVALRVAERIQPPGKVIGIDLSPEMLALARRKLPAAGMPEVEFRKGDGRSLVYPDRSFDAVLCASALFFFDDMLGALREWLRVLTPGGLVGVSSFGPSFLQPLRDLWRACLGRRGLEGPVLPTNRLVDTAECRLLLSEAGFGEVEVRSEQLGYYLASPVERWADIEAGLEGTPLSSLDPDERSQIRAEHLEGLASLVPPRGIWVDVSVIFAFGRKTIGPSS
jgi:ubiquinone/menaquinone biosynthesis C-methylase UbiE